MGHGEETPRQKMIGMMYLVLTAMLALNVSSEVLEAFVLVENGLSRTTENYRIKNDKLYLEVDKAYEINPVKVKETKDRSDKIKQMVNDIYNYVQDLKKEVITESEGSDAPSIKGNEIDASLIKNKSDLDVGGQVLIGLNGNGKAFELKRKIIEFRKYVVSLIDPNKGEDLIKSINGILDTSDPPKKEDGTVNTWESARFEHIPLASVIPQLTKVQVDILNTEAEVVNYLLGQIGATEFKFNVLSATVIPSSNIVFKGGEFNAEVFLAASDTTQKPNIYLCRYDSSLTKSGTWEYNAVGTKTDIPVSKNGRGHYVTKPTQLGNVNWSGLIEIKAPDGSIVRKPFKHSYSVLEPNVVIAPTKMNVLYLGVDNPVEISIPGVSPNKVSATISKGSIKPDRSSGGYLVQPGTGVPNCQISVYAEMENRKKVLMGSKLFRIKRVPPPNPKVIGIDRKIVERNQLAASLGLIAEMPQDFEFELTYKVVSFKLSATVGGFLQEREANSSRFTDDQRKLMNNLRSGSQVAFTDIKAVGPSGDVIDLNDLVYKIR